MTKAKITSNGMINFPAKIRKKLKLKPGDEVSFVETDDGILLVPITNILDATNPAENEEAVSIVTQLHKERREEEW